MSLQARMESLKTRHGALDAQLSEEACRPKPDERVVTRLKGAKLRLKDEMERLARDH